MASAASLRRPVAGSGNVTVAHMGTRPARLTFTQAQQFKRGAQVVMWNTSTELYEKYTIDFGEDTEWSAFQKCASAQAFTTWYRPNLTASRQRGGASAPTYCVYTPRAWHYLYVAPLDDQGNPDWYTYIDTLIPERGRHPYTRDMWTGQQWLSEDQNANVDVGLVPDVATRVADLDAFPPILTS